VGERIDNATISGKAQLRMTDQPDPQPAGPAASPVAPDSQAADRRVLVRYADGSGKRVAHAFATLLEAVLGRKVAVEHRITGAAAGGAAPLVVTVDTAPRHVLPGAMAIIALDGGTFGFGDRPPAAPRTGTGAVTLADAATRPAVRDLVHALALETAGATTGVDTTFAQAWPAFEQAMLPSPTPAKASPWWLIALGILGGAIVLAVLATLLAWSFALWSFAPPAGPCQDLAGRDRVDCDWRQFVARHSTRASGANVALETQLAHRPFAILERRTGCGAGSSVEEHHLVVQGGSVHGARIDAVSAAPPGTPSAPPPVVVATLDEDATSMRQWACAGTHHALRPRFIGTLSPTEICRSLDAVRRTLPDRPGSVGHLDGRALTLDLLAGYLASSQAAPRGEMERRLEDWASRCGIP
jgi:hypothetical protein